MKSKLNDNNGADETVAVAENYSAFCEFVGTFTYINSSKFLSNLIDISNSILKLRKWKFRKVILAVLGEIYEPRSSDSKSNVYCHATVKINI